MALNNMTTGINCKGYHCEAVIQTCFTIVSIFVISVGIYCNGLICLLVYQKPSMRSAINLLLAVLAATDFSTVFFSVTVSTLTLLTNNLMKWTLGSQTLCYAHALAHLWFLIVNATVLMIISIDRHIIITRKMEFLTTSRVKKLMILVIIFALTFSFLSLIPPMGYKHVIGSTKCVLKNATSLWGYFYVIFVYFFTFLTPFLVMCFTCARVVFAVKQNHVRIDLFGDSCSIYKVSSGDTGMSKYCQPRVDLRFKTRTFYNIAILCFIFVLCRGPYCTYLLVMNFTGSFSPFVHVLLLWLYYLNPALNSLVCVWRIRKFRKKFLFIFSHFCYCGDLESKSSFRIKPSSGLSDEFTLKTNSI